MTDTERKPVELGTLEQWFTDSEDESRDAREMSEKARDYYDNVQLTQSEINALNKRKQPKVVFNRIAPKIDFLLGTERKARTAPKAYPRTPEHDEAANAATDGLRYVTDNQDFDIKASNTFEHMLIEGTGGLTVEVQGKRDEIEIVLRQIRWDRWFADPYSLDRNYTDAKYTGIVAWKDLVEAQQRWPDKADEIEGAFSQFADSSDTYDDKPVRWFNKSRRRVMCIDMYFLWAGIWHHTIFMKGVFLVKPEVSKYEDEDGLPDNPQICVSAKVKRDGQRYGAVEALMDVQDEINKRRSKSLHILTTKQTFAKDGQITDIDAFKREANKPDGHLQFPQAGEFGKDFGVIPNESLVGPQFQMYQDAMNQIDNLQANAALQGQIQSDLSGRAIQSLQQGGMVELTPLFDAHAMWKKRVYRAIWNRIRQFWREEKWIRVTDDEDNLKFVGLNQPVTMAEKSIMDQTGMSMKEVQEQFGPEIQAIIQQQPAMGEPVALENNVAEIDVDIIVDEVPDVVNLQSEQFDLLVKMYQANPEGIDWEDVISMSTLRNKDRILNKELEPEEQEALEARQQEEAELKEIAKAKEMSEIKKNEAEAVKDLAEAEAQRIENEAVQSGIAQLAESLNA